MSNLKVLVQFAKDYNIPQESLGFYGLHDTVFLDYPEGLGPDYRNMSLEHLEELHSNYGLSVIEGELGFYT